MTVLRAALSYIVSRATALALIALAVHLIAQPGRRLDSFNPYGQLRSALDDVNRALSIRRA